MEAGETRDAALAVLPWGDLGRSPAPLRASVSPRLWPGRGSFWGCRDKCVQKGEKKREISVAGGFPATPGTGKESGNPCSEGKMGDFCLDFLLSPPKQVSPGSLLCPPQRGLSHNRQRIWLSLTLAVVPRCGLARSRPVSGLGWCWHRTEPRVEPVASAGQRPAPPRLRPVTNPGMGKQFPGCHHVTAAPGAHRAPSAGRWCPQA